MVFKKNKEKNITKDKIDVELNNRRWKEKDEKYLNELQKFFDKVEKIKDEDLRDNILNQMLLCDRALTEVAEENFLKYYEIGLKQAKNE